MGTLVRATGLKPCQLAATNGTFARVAADPGPLSGSVETLVVPRVL